MHHLSQKRTYVLDFAALSCIMNLGNTNFALLYAVHEDDADNAYSFLLECLKEDGNEEGFISGAGYAASRIKDIWVRQINSALNNASVEHTRSSKGDATVYGKKSRGYTDDALRNVLENIFKERESSGDTGVKLQDRLSTADQNRVVILEDKIKKIQDDIKEIERHCYCRREVGLWKKKKYIFA